MRDVCSFSDRRRARPLLASSDRAHPELELVQVYRAGVVLVECGHAVLHVLVVDAFDALRHQECLHLRRGELALGSPIVAGGMVYVVTTQGFVYALEGGGMAPNPHKGWWARRAANNMSNSQVFFNAN